MLNEEIIDTMIRSARMARNNAYSPYSDMAVGACVLASDGTLYGGCNVENSTLGASMCAERVAIFKAVADGKTEFDGIAVIADTEEAFVPCGCCSQVISEFNIPEIIMANLDGDIRVLNSDELAPFAVFMGSSRTR